MRRPMLTQGCSTERMDGVSQMRLNLPRVYYQHEEFALSGTQKPLQVTQFHFQEQFSMNLFCSVFANNLI